MKPYLFIFLVILCSFTKPESPKPRVLVFLDTECPICQKMTPKIRTLAKQYEGKVSFLLVYPTHTATAAEVTAFEKSYELPHTHQLDPDHTLVTRYKVTTTPEIVLLSSENKVLYQGNVDDQFYKLGAYRPAPTQHYLRDAIDATLENRPVAINRTPAVGCLINHSH